jgi:hypothetical protein
MTPKSSATTRAWQASARQHAAPHVIRGPPGDCYSWCAPIDVPAPRLQYRDLVACGCLHSAPPPIASEDWPKALLSAKSHYVDSALLAGYRGGKAKLCASLVSGRSLLAPLVSTNCERL